MSKPIVVIACMLSSSESWEPQTAPTSLALTCRWRSRPQHQNRSGATAANLRLLDHLVSAGEQPRRQLQSERLRGDPVHDEIELGRLFYGSDVAACSRASQYRNSRTKGVRLITVE